MALISCPECKTTVSDQASNCPHCGYPIKQVSAPAQKLSETSSAQDSGSESTSGSPKRGGHVLAWVFGIIVAVPIVLIGGIYIHNKMIGPVGWAQDNTEKALRAHMKDPASMVIRSSYVVQKTDAKGDQLIYVCGIVDGKNSFGGYAGGTRFASKSESSKSLDTFDTWSVQMEDPDDERTANKIGELSAFVGVYWNAWCVDATHPALVASKSG